MTGKPVHLAVYDTFADWETGYATAHLTQHGYAVRTVGPTVSRDHHGGLRVQPVSHWTSRRALRQLAVDPPWRRPLGRRGRPGALRPQGAGVPGAGVPVAAICGATAGLAREGLLDEREHTSAVSHYLAATGYRAASATATRTP